MWQVYYSSKPMPTDHEDLRTALIAWNIHNTIPRKTRNTTTIEDFLLQFDAEAKQRELIKKKNDPVHTQHMYQKFKAFAAVHNAAIEQKA